MTDIHFSQLDAITGRPEDIQQLINDLLLAGAQAKAFAEPLFEQKHANLQGWLIGIVR